MRRRPRGRRFRSGPWARERTVVPMTAVASEWGTTAPERTMPLPCDRQLPGAELRLHRAVDVAAPAATVFRWLCQLRAAPYSYDLIDNFGRRSPPRLTPGLERLERGQRFMTIFRLVDFEPGEQITLLTHGPIGSFAVTYAVVPQGEERSRLLVRIAATGPALMRRLAPALDLVMMRRQLINLKGLAEPLPRIDEHTAEVEADPDVAWQALERVMLSESSAPAKLFGRLVGATRGELVGFRVTRSEPPRLLELEGEHRFSRYRLRFELEGLSGGRTTVRAVTDALFPGMTGAAYRALVIGTGGHVLAVRRLLGAVSSATRTPRRTARRRP